MPRFRLRLLGGAEINLPAGELLIGRLPECFLRVNEPTVSRLHARLRVSADRVLLEDLGSRNGCSVNGVRVGEPLLLAPGDRLVIGSQHFVLESSEEEATERGQERARVPTATGVPVLALAGPSSLSGPTLDFPKVGPRSSDTEPASAPPSSPSSPGLPSIDALLLAGGRPSSSLRLISGLSDRLLSLGRVEEAERMLGPRLRELHSRALAGDVGGEESVQEMLRRVLRLAAATRKDEWSRWLFDYARACRYRMPSAFLDEIYAHLFACRPPIAASILTYSLAVDDESLRLRLSTLRKLCRG